MNVQMMNMNAKHECTLFANIFVMIKDIVAQFTPVFTNEH